MDNKNQHMGNAVANVIEICCDLIVNLDRSIWLIHHEINLWILTE